MDKQFEKLWNELNIELGKYIISKVKQKQDAEDILQDVYVKIYKNIDQVENRSAIKSWVYQITKNTIIDFYKKRKNLIVAPETLNYIAEETDTESNMNEEIIECLEAMIFKLPEKYQEVYDLYEKKNMKHKEIMNELDISLSTSKIRLKRAREMFKKNILECCHIEVDIYGNVVEYRSKKETCNVCDDTKSPKSC